MRSFAWKIPKEAWSQDFLSMERSFGSAKSHRSTATSVPNLSVADPDAVFAQALRAGASQVYPVSEEHGWRLGRVLDPFGHHWEIGRPLGT
jgi:uncharacterized glyoxalase superfamily protein PhnB